jgi:hypothetical protein
MDVFNRLFASYERRIRNLARQLGIGDQGEGILRWSAYTIVWAVMIGLFIGLIGNAFILQWVFVAGVNILRDFLGESQTFCDYPDLTGRHWAAIALGVTADWIVAREYVRLRPEAMNKILVACKALRTHNMGVGSMLRYYVAGSPSNWRFVITKVSGDTATLLGVEAPYHKSRVSISDLIENYRPE